MTKTRHKENKPGSFRLAVMDDVSHKQLYTLHFTRTSFAIAVISTIVILSAMIFAIIAYTPARTFIPGYPDARSKRAAIQNAITIDSLERVIYRWELYSENFKRVIAGEEPVKIDSLIRMSETTAISEKRAKGLMSSDSLLRRQVAQEEQFDISARDRRKLPMEGLHFFTPLKGVVSQGYDPHIHPYIDVTAQKGSVVKATLDGTVIFAGWSNDSGHTIQIQHEGDIVSIYKHNEKLLKKTGDKVSAGAPIALIGNSGESSTGTHLHFELWHQGETVDPQKFINF